MTINMEFFGFSQQGNNDLQFSLGGSFIIGSGEINKATKTGFLYIPATADAPTGVPISYPGRIPIVFDYTHNYLYIYNGGWKKTTAFS